MNLDDVHADTYPEQPALARHMALYSHPFRGCFSWEENAGSLFGTHPLGDWGGEGATC